MSRTAYDITLRYGDDKVESFTYHADTNTVSGVATTDVPQVTYAQAREYQKATAGFIYLINKQCTPAASAQKQDFHLEITELPSPKRIRFEWSQGDLAVDVTYDRVEDNLNGSQSAFTLSWCDFLAYTRGWAEFLTEIGRYG